MPDDLRIVWKDDIVALLLRSDARRPDVSLRRCGERASRLSLRERTPHNNRLPMQRHAPLPSSPSHERDSLKNDTAYSVAGAGAGGAIASAVVNAQWLPTPSILLLRSPKVLLTSEPSVKPDVSYSPPYLLGTT